MHRIIKPLPHRKISLYPYPARTTSRSLTVMSPETHLPPPEPPIISLPEIAPETTAAQENADIPAPPPKRQRRPSVRLGEIGEQHGPFRRHNRPPWSWRVSKESSRNSKPRAVSNLVNGVDGDDGDDFGNNPRNKAKRGSTKRLRSNHASKPIDENGSKRFKNFDHDHNPNGHTYSVDENDFMQMDRNDDNRLRVWENDVGGVESESRERRKNEGVWSWLFDLGLSRYAPVFEMHEVDDDLLPLLTLEDLKDMGISAVGSRRKMYNAIEKLRKGF